MRLYNDNPNRDPNIWWHRTIWEDISNNRNEIAIALAVVVYAVCAVLLVIFS